MEAVFQLEIRLFGAYNLSSACDPQLHHISPREEELLHVTDYFAHDVSTRNINTKHHTLVLPILSASENPTALH